MLGSAGSESPPTDDSNIMEKVDFMVSDSRVGPSWTGNILGGGGWILIRSKRGLTEDGWQELC